MKTFLWGAATSSHQIEGDNRHNDWWAWEAQGNIEGGVLSGKATDHWNRFREDIRLAKELGLTSYRFSIEWSRLEPEEGKWDPAAFEWYRNLIRECEKNGLVPMLTLHHFTSPRWFAERGGFTWDGCVDAFARYTSQVIKELGAPIKMWCTINEPLVLTVGTYLAKFMPPAQFSQKNAAKTFRNLFACHVVAYDLIHRELPDVQVGFAHNMVDFLPDRAWHPLDVISARAFSWFYNQKWLNAAMGKSENFGVPGLLPKQPLVKEAVGRRTCDYIGLNYYMKAHVRWSPGAPDMPFAVVYARDDDTVSDLGWAVHPSGFGKMIRKVARYGLPIYITENGIADADDSRRTNYIKTHLEEVAKAIADGADVRGFYYWSLLDNFEWIKGYGPRFGLFHVDYENFTRTERPSAGYYRRVIAAHGGSRHPSLAAIHAADALREDEKVGAQGLKSQPQSGSLPTVQEF